MGDQSQKTLQSDGQKTANSFGKCKYFSHSLSRAALLGRRGETRYGLCVRRFQGGCRRWTRPLSSSRVCRIVEERLTDAISSAPKADYTKVLIGAAFNTAR
ncbi:hypothetical protein [Shinella oryzae]|uniref:Uncharacterized protein n=1 Tax=Shinella oryzae TaxID=2871820 RepID=A0ABY9K440_9HYPH|nr:hypothetical protein [Shinella oryzae]WLS03338.1 hypothetical protein Q9315_01465 [Shinella oryzae]